MKLYSYSTELIAFVEAKWLKTKCLIAGILMGAIIFFGPIAFNKSIADVFQEHSVKALTLENNILRQQLRLMVPRMDNLEIQMGQLHKLDNNLHMLLPHRKVILDSVPQPWVGAKSSNFSLLSQQR